ncbi:MAG: SUMF1/EgtB/PvdO family nonheme iron enzyme [Verrucomicrobiota bacterium]
MQINRLHLAWGFTVLATAAPALAETRAFDLGNSVRLEVRRIPKGRFLMGSPDSEAGRNADEKPHTVVLSRDFYLGRTAVTFAQWERFALETGYRSEAETGTSGGFGWNGTALEQRRDFNWRNTGYPQTPEHPVVMVTWEDSRQFLKWLSRKTGWTFELPAEARWEYACRAGTTTAWWSGNEASAAGAGIYSKESSGNQAHPVTSRPANPWGLHISGNVWEWCADWFGPYDFLSVTDPLQRTAPASDKPRRVLRGGSWLRPLKDTRSAARYRNDARSRNADNGFRVMSFGPDAAAAGSTAPPSNPPSAPTDVEPPDRAPSPASSGPATPPRFPDSAPPPVSPHPPAQAGKRGGSWLLLILLGGMAVWIARRILRALANRPPLPDRRTRSGMRPPPPPPLREPLDLVPGAFLTRGVDDGFWLNAGYAAGTWLNLTWRDEHGLLRERRVQYAPGDDGHFIYTGSIPEQIQASAGEPDAIPPLPLPLPVTSPEPENFSQNDGTASSRHPRPGHRPSAY